MKLKALLLTQQTLSSRATGVLAPVPQALLQLGGHASIMDVMVALLSLWLL